MILAFRPLKTRPAHWLGAHDERPGSPFHAPYAKTLELLDFELDQLDAVDVFLQVETQGGNLRVDGQLRADARVDHPGVILTIETDKLGTLIYETDRFGRSWRSGSVAWQENLRAIALGLEALRKVERYGIARRGQQYAGYRELGSGIAMGPAAMTEAEALRILEFGPAAGPELIAGSYRRLAKDLHPDAGGDPDKFRRLTQARDFLVGQP